LFAKKKSFKNAIIQNVGSGNTMAFNYETKKLLLAMPKKKIVTHDWALYQIVSANNGKIFYEKTPYINYRQHENNAIGVLLGYKAIVKHLKLLLGGTIKDWNNKNLSALNSIHLTPVSEKIIEQLILSQEKTNLEKLKIYLRIGIYRQNNLGQIALYFSLLLGKI